MVVLVILDAALTETTLIALGRLILRPDGEFRGGIRFLALSRAALPAADGRVCGRRGGL